MHSTASHPNRIVRSIAALAVTAALAACGGAASGPTPMPGASNFGEFREAFCATWQSIFTAMGNPDLGSGSELTHALDAAIERGDLVAVEAAALAIREELEAGRRHAAFGGAWEPGATGMGQLDRLIVAFEASIEAKRAAAGQGLRDANEQSEAAIEAAGGMDAWRAVLTPATWAAAIAERPADAPSGSCEGLPISI